MKNSLGRFLVGGLAGFIWEKIVAPDLPGALPLPFRPIYGFGAALATEDLGKNCATALAAEQLVGKFRPDLWQYDENDPLAINRSSRADYIAFFGIAMAAADAVFNKVENLGDRKSVV